MAQVLHKRATTTHAIRAELQRSQDSIATLSKRYNLNPKTVIKWRKRDSVEDQPMGPREPHSTSLTLAEEAAAGRRRCCLWTIACSLAALHTQAFALRPASALLATWHQQLPALS